MIERILFSFKRVINSFLRWDLVVHVTKNLPRTVGLFLPDKQVLAAEMDLLAVSRHVAFEERGRNRDVTHQMEAVQLSVSVNGTNCGLAKSFL